MRDYRRRLDFRIRVSGDEVRAQPGQSEICIVKNLSVGGLFVASNQRWPVGDSLPLKLFYKGESSESLCRITHLQADGVGFAFTEPSRPLLVFIRSTIDDLLSDGGALMETRTASRAPIKAAIVYFNGDNQTQAWLRDLSITGAFIETDNSPAIGVQTLVYLPGFAFSKGSSQKSELRGCLAMVVRIAENGFGCQFVNPSAEFQMAISALLTAEKPV